MVDIPPRSPAKSGIPAGYTSLFKKFSLVPSTLVHTTVSVQKRTFESDLPLPPNPDSIISCHQQPNLTTMKSKSNPDLEQIIILMREKEQEYMPFDYYMASGKNPCEDLVDVDCRTRMVDWSIQIIDYCNLSRETVAIAVNFLDRFLCHATWALEDRSVFQLAAISCLYTAIKIHEPKAISSNSMVALSRNKFSSDQIEKMEQSILKEIKWRCYPPTTFAFGYCYCMILADLCEELDFATIWEATRLQLETSLNVFQFALMQSSLIALAAVINAVESYPPAVSLEKEEIVDSLQAITRIQSPIDAIETIRKRLYELISTLPLPESPQVCKASNRLPSPRTVSVMETSARH